MIEEELVKHIRKFVGRFKKEEELLSVLKARLTKREYKMLLSWSEDESEDSISTKLKLDDSSYEELSTKLIKKLNQEKLKQELAD